MVNDKQISGKNNLILFWKRINIGTENRELKKLVKTLIKNTFLLLRDKEQKKFYMTITSVLPCSMGFPKNSSAKTQPTLHKSTEAV